MLTHKDIIDRCRELRKNQTDAEAFLWKHLRNRKFNGLKFLRQHPLIYGGLNNKINFFIADFYCDQKKIVIELDGKIHEQQKEYDQQRDLVMKSLEIRTLRIKNEDVKEFRKIIEEFLQGKTS